MSEKHLPALIALALLLIAWCLPVRSARAAPEEPLSSLVVYCVYPSIASARGDFAGVTAQLPRLKRLGINVIWLMPVTPIGQAVGGHPAFGSPYAVHDYYGLNPRYGTPGDLKRLVATAHRLRMRVLLDEVLNHTAWDNALLTAHPEFYVHGDGNPRNSGSVVQAFNFGDVAQLDYGNHALWEYMNSMLANWVREYHVDGFRFDTADDPGGPKRMIPAEFWQRVGDFLHAAKPDIILLGECETPDLALKPFQIDYGWNLFGALKAASNGGDAADVVAAWSRQTDSFPKGMLHLSIQDNWDTPRDIAAFGGPAGAMAAAVFNFTINGVPLVYNGMEIGNAAGGVNPHAPIPWDKGTPGFPAFYEQLIALRANAALRQGSLRWLTNSTPRQVLTYTRREGDSQFLVVINLSKTAAIGRISLPDGPSWVDVTPGATPRPTGARVDPARYQLGPGGFAVYRRTVRAIPVYQ